MIEMLIDDGMICLVGDYAPEQSLASGAATPPESAITVWSGGDIAAREMKLECLGEVVVRQPVQ